MSFSGGHKCQNLKSVNGSHQYNMAVELQVVLLLLSLKWECSLPDTREVLTACKLFASSSFCLMACSHHCSIKAPSLNTVSNVTNLMADMIYFVSCILQEDRGCSEYLGAFSYFTSLSGYSWFLLGKANER